MVTDSTLTKINATRALELDSERWVSWIRRPTWVFAVALLSAAQITNLLAQEGQEPQDEQEQPELAQANEAGQPWVLERPLVPFEAQYTVGNDVINVAGRANIELVQSGSENEWSYSLNTQPAGLFKLTGKGRVQESATFEIVDENNTSTLRPKRYKFRQDNEHRRSIDATFIWEQRQLYFNRGDDNDTSDLALNTLDRMTMTVVMMSNLTTDLTSTTMEIFDGGRLKQVRLVNEGTDELKTVLGTVEAVRVRSRSSAGSTRETITWFAPSLNNIPVRIEQLKNGELVARLSISLYRPTP